MSAMSSASTANFSSADFEDFELSAASNSRVAFVPAICRKYSTSARPRTDGARLSTSSRKSKLCCAGIGSRGARGLDAVRLADLERGEACAPLYRAVDTDSVVEVAVQSSMSIIPKSRNIARRSHSGRVGLIPLRNWTRHLRIPQFPLCLGDSHSRPIYLFTRRVFHDRPLAPDSTTAISNR